jgi:hypothetical protein
MFGRLCLWGHFVSKMLSSFYIVRCCDSYVFISAENLIFLLCVVCASGSRDINVER